MAVQNPQGVLDEILYKVSNLETKVRLTEQNFFNSQERVELLSRNFLDLKKELLGRVDNLTHEAHDFSRALSEIRNKLALIESKLSAIPKITPAQQASAITAEISAEDASKTLDDVLKKLGA